jgi:hypothetical protein
MTDNDKVTLLCGRMLQFLAYCCSVAVLQFTCFVSEKLNFGPAVDVNLSAYCVDLDKVKVKCPLTRHVGLDTANGMLGFHTYLGIWQNWMGKLSAPRATLNPTA